MTFDGSDSSSHSDPMARHQLQQALDALVAGGAPGALAELRDERHTWSISSGTAELGTERPVDPQGSFRIGSVTKTFTATVVLQLLGEGKLGLDDTLDRWLPDLVPASEKITLLHLLNHTSGLYDYTSDLNNADILRHRSKHWQPREIIAMATKHEPLFEPGTSRQYCNTGYILLGMVIEKVTGRRFAEQVEDRILRPLDLRHTSARTDTDRLPDPHAHGYLPVDNRAVDVTAFNTSQAWAAGGMVSTARDLNRLYAGLLTGGLLRSPELLAMKTTVPTNIPGVEAGLGIVRVTLAGGITVWGKDGGFFGYHTLPFHLEDCSRQLTVSITVAHNRRPATHEFLGAVAKVFHITPPTSSSPGRTPPTPPL